MSVSIIGIDDGWEESRPRQWSINSEGVDVLTLTYEGPYSTLSSFLSGFSKWESGPEGTTFLSDVRNNGNRVFPEVQVDYVGLKSSSSNDIRENSDDVTQNATWTNPPDAEPVTVDLTYTSPVVTSEQISTTRATSYIGAITPADIDEDQVVWWVVNGTFVGTPDTASVLALFSSRILVLAASQEIVPGELYRNITQQTKLLFAEH